MNQALICGGVAYLRRSVMHRRRKTLQEPRTYTHELQRVISSGKHARIDPCIASPDIAFKLVVRESENAPSPELCSPSGITPSPSRPRKPAVETHNNYVKRRGIADREEDSS